MGAELFVALIGASASVVTIVTGIGYFLDKNGQRIDKRFGAVIQHMERMEKSLNDMKADLPFKYTLREDHMRLSDKVHVLDREFMSWKAKNDESPL